MKNFLTVNDQFLQNIITNASNRIVIVSPGVSLQVAQTIVCFVDKYGAHAVELVLDADPEVCRLGYGNLEAIDLLTGKGVVIRKALRLRIGVLIADDRAWVFTPTPLVVEDTPGEGKPNAVVLATHQVEEMIKSICPTLGEGRKPSPTFG